MVIWYALIHMYVFVHEHVVIVIGVCLLLCFVFFFKQKTAYEMRISDWSSDVCSSDLCCSPPLSVPARWWRAAARLGKRSRRSLSDQEIGRASCRERVCQYV